MKIIALSSVVLLALSSTQAYVIPTTHNVYWKMDLYGMKYITGTYTTSVLSVNAIDPVEWFLTDVTTSADEHQYYTIKKASD